MKSIIKITFALAIFCSTALAGDMTTGGFTMEGDMTTGGKTCTQNCVTDGDQGSGGLTSEGDMTTGGRAAVAIVISEYFAGLFH